MARRERAGGESSAFGDDGQQTNSPASNSSPPSGIEQQETAPNVLVLVYKRASALPDDPPANKGASALMNSFVLDEACLMEKSMELPAEGKLIHCDAKYHGISCKLLLDKGKLIHVDDAKDHGISCKLFLDKSSQINHTRREQVSNEDKTKPAHEWHVAMDTEVTRILPWLLLLKKFSSFGLLIYFSRTQHYSITNIYFVCI